MTIGREADLPLGVSLADQGVSRIALTLQAGARGWVFNVGNRNGAVLYQWAQAPSWLPAGTARLVRWPRAAIRVAGERAELEHWVLLAADGYGVPNPTAPSDADATRVPRTPRELTSVQIDAIRTVFAEHLAWPPKLSPAPRSLEAAGKRLGITPSAVRERLQAACDRAITLGLHRPYGVTDPGYVFHLAAHGYLGPNYS